ncbi:MAG TPA: polysaccharide biosynthesis tyrosine autokinase [Stellaceae bacterium]|jgi:exopolysaccharide/PEP-CTERM locus tyrosine autokinase|nr:polysaccharide biosynthesis tyrosine autokinase [Stellaceae bacterium]
MAESIGLIERAAALLKQREAAASGRVSPPPVPPPSPLDPEELVAGEAGGAAGPAAELDVGIGPELVLDRGQLASYGIALPSSERSRTVEEFRLIKRNLMAAGLQGGATTAHRQSRLIMVTSSRPGEGKTFIALNLALAFASERDVKALLVDVDTQHSTLQKILGIGGHRGIVDVLGGHADLSEVLLRTNLPNFLVLPAGRGGPHVPELLSSRRMAALLAEMGQRYADRFIILDTPPCMATSDAATLAPLVGQVVFVVEANRTQQEEIEAGLSLLSGCPQISLLLNKSDLASEHFGSYGYGYHYPGGGGDELRSDRPAPA